MSRNTISHDNFSQRLRNYPTKNENVAYFSQSSISEQDAANKFFKQWKNSPGHHRNMIAKNVRFELQIYVLVHVIKTCTLVCTSLEALK